MKQPMTKVAPMKPGERVDIILSSWLDANEKLVAICIAQRLNRLGATWLNVEHIVERTSLSRATVFRVLQRGEQSGWLVRVHNHRSASVFRLDLDFLARPRRIIETF